MKPLRAIGLSLVLCASVCQAGAYQKTGCFFSMIDTISDFQFWGVGLQYEAGQQGDWGSLGAEFRVSYDMYEETDSSSYADDNRKCSIVPLEVGAKYALAAGARWAPYASLGVGLYMFEDYTDFDYDSIVGFHGALGAEFYIDPSVGLYLQLKYTQATDEVEGNGFGDEYGVEGLGGDMGIFLKF